MSDPRVIQFPQLQQPPQPSQRSQHVSQLPSIPEDGEEKKSQAPVPPPTYIVVRDTAYLNMTEEFLNKSGLHLDGDVYQLSQQGYTPVRKNASRLVTDNSFYKDAKTVGAVTHDEESVRNLESYLYSEGKMPQFLGLRLVDGQLQVYAKRPIAAHTYLGKFEGLYRPLDAFKGKPWTRVVVDFDRKDVAIIDADNILFSNWTRYLAPFPPEKANCSCNAVNFNVLVFCDKPIAEGEALLSAN